MRRDTFALLELLAIILGPPLAHLSVRRLPPSATEASTVPSAWSIPARQENYAGEPSSLDEAS